MEITKTYNWNRRDFSCDVTCQHCGHEEKKLSGYDDDNYYNNVIMDMKCKKCGESTNSKPTNDLKTITIPRHDPNAII